MLEGRTYQDGRELSREEFYRRLPRLSSPPTTAAPSPASFEDVYRKLFERGFKRILSIHISSKLSGMINAAAQAAQQFGDRVHIFDSGQASVGLGFQVIEAGRAAARGLSLEDVREHARRTRERVQVIALIDTLEYLRRSGRVSWLRAGIGDLLKIKLLVRLRDGVVEPLSRIRTRQRALESLAEMAAQWSPIERLAILHANAAEDARALAHRLGSFCAEVPWTIDVTTIIGVHVGPGAVGLAALPGP